MSYPNWIYSMFSFIGFLLVTIPFPWHLEAWNTGTCLYMAWTGIACLNQFINSIIWNGNAIDWAPVWCDISSRIMVGSAVAIPCASLCINRRLYHISSANTVTITKAEKRRAIMVDLAIGVGIPVLQMVMQYIVQGHRYNIFEDVGCYPFTYNTPVAYVLVITWPIVIGLISGVYCVMSIKAFNKRRAQFKELLSSNANLTSNRYFRLMCLAGIEVLCTVPLGAYALSLDIRAGISPWRGWADTHYGFSRVDQIPAILWKNSPVLASSLELSRWLVIVCAFIFFGFFGFADEAKKNYKAALTSVAKKVGYSTASMSSGGTMSSDGTRWKGPGMSSTGRGATLPVFIHKETSRKRDSFESFTNMSVSYNGETMNEKSFGGGDISFGALSLADVGGTLADYKEDHLSSVPSSGSSSASSISEPPSYPAPAVMRGDDDDENAIEISSVRRMSTAHTFVITPPEPVLNLHNAPRHPTDTPAPVSGSLEVV